MSEKWDKSEKGQASVEE